MGGKCIAKLREASRGLVVVEEVVGGKRLVIGSVSIASMPVVSHQLVLISPLGDNTKPGDVTGSCQEAGMLSIRGVCSGVWGMLLLLLFIGNGAANCPSLRNWPVRKGSSMKPLTKFILLLLLLLPFIS